MRSGIGKVSTIRNSMVCTVHLKWPGRLKRATRVARMKVGRSTSKIVKYKPTGQRPLGRPECR